MRAPLTFSVGDQTTATQSRAHKLPMSRQKKIGEQISDFCFRSITNHVNNEFIFETLRYVPLLHSTNIATLKMKRNLRILQDILDFNNISIESLFRRLSPTASCKDLLQRCMWKNSVYRCEQLFQQIFTTVSLCCVFNYFALPSDRRSNSDLIPMPKPRRVASCGYQTALEVLISTDYDDYYSNNIVSSGALVLIDNAYNMPDLDSTVRLINPSTEVLIALSPEQTYTTPGVKSFKPEERQCYYHDEIKIGDFLQYSFHNCMAYQKIEIIKKSCHCIPFYFPKRSKEQTRVCNFRDIECLENNILPASDLEMRKELLKEYVECLPECEHFDYPLEVALGNIANDVPLNGLPFYQNINLKNRSILNVFFNDLVSTRYRRDVYLNWQNILASFGGLLSLMLGFTLISGIDLVLFFVFRIFYDFISRPRKVMSTIIHVQEAPQERIRKNKKNIYDIHRSFMDMQNQ
ncbi:sodium channel protein Nach-like [Battus philenor]|uniref:sodium channel protein Nach-like n=1 Tax=Battus philenor TaxID=42288 RepID=UPI0035D13580